jgi:uncharacterized Ntn-hydrolase superfamily protein
VNVEDQKQREAAQMRVLRPLLGLTRRHKQRDIDVRIKLNQDNIVDKIRNYQKNWPRYIKRIENKRFSEVALQYQSHGKGDIGRPGIK